MKECTDIRKISDEYWMDFALAEARAALSENEIPIGAVLVKDRKIIAADHNRTNRSGNPLAHAEKLIIEKMILQGKKFLYEYSLYVTIEPCLMCAGIIILSRVGKVVFGSYDEKAGACGSVYNVLLDKSFNHHPQLVTDVLQEECSLLMSEFFRGKRVTNETVR